MSSFIIVENGIRAGVIRRTVLHIQIEIGSAIFHIFLGPHVLNGVIMWHNGYSVKNGLVVANPLLKGLDPFAELISIFVDLSLFKKLKEFLPFLLYRF